MAYDPTKTSYEQLLDVFWNSHDPTALNQQGTDVGTWYRSVIFYHDEQERLIAEQSKREAQKRFSREIITDVKPLTNFHEVENYHQDYYRNNPNVPYCVFVIRPKLEKLEKLAKAR